VQYERDTAKVQSRTLTLRDEDLLRKSMGDERLPNRRSKRTAQAPHPLVQVMKRPRAQSEPDAADVRRSVRAASAIASKSVLES
jgi:hypothetical protein